MNFSKQLLFLSFFFGSLWARGQAKGKISGSIANAFDKSPIEYASVSLIQQPGGKVVNGTVTDKKGHFVISDVAPGSYVIKVESIGSQTLTTHYDLTANGNTNTGTRYHIT